MCKKGISHHHNCMLFFFLSGCFLLFFFSNLRVFSGILLPMCVKCECLRMVSFGGICLLHFSTTVDFSGRGTKKKERRIAKIRKLSSGAKNKAVTDLLIGLLIEGRTMWLCGCVKMNLTVIALLSSFWQRKPGRDLHLKHITPIKDSWICADVCLCWLFFLRILGFCLMLFLMGFHVCVVRPLV